MSDVSTPVATPATGSATITPQVTPCALRGVVNHSPGNFPIASGVPTDDSNTFGSSLDCETSSDSIIPKVASPSAFTPFKGAFAIKVGPCEESTPQGWSWMEAAGLTAAAQGSTPAEGKPLVRTERLRK